MRLLRSYAPFALLPLFAACGDDRAAPPDTSDTSDTSDATADTADVTAPPDADDTAAPDTTPGDVVPDADPPDTAADPVLHGVSLEPASVEFDASHPVLATLEVTGFDAGRDLSRLTITSSTGSAFTPTLVAASCPADRVCVSFTPTPTAGPGRMTLTFALAGRTVDATLGLRTPTRSLTGPFEPPTPIPGLGRSLDASSADLDGDGAPELLVLHRADVALPNGLVDNVPIVTVFGVKPARLVFEPVGTYELGPTEGGEGEVTVFTRTVANILDTDSRYLDVVYYSSGRLTRSPTGALELAISLDAISATGVDRHVVRVPVDHAFLALVPESGESPGRPWVLTVGGAPDTRLFLHRFPESGTPVLAPLEVSLPADLLADLASGRRGFDARILATADPASGVLRRTLDLAVPLAPDENWCGDTDHFRVLQVRGIIGEALTVAPLACREVPSLTDDFGDFDPATLGLRIERPAPLRFTDDTDETRLELELLGGVMTHDDGDLEARYQVSATWTAAGLAPRRELLFEGRGHAPPSFELVTRATAAGGTCQHLAISGHDHRLGDFIAHIPGPYCGATTTALATAPRPAGTSRRWNRMDFDGVADSTASTCHHYSQMIWSRPSQVACGAPASPTLDHDEGTLSIEGDLAFIGPAPTTDAPFVEDLSTGGRSLLEQHAFDAPDGGHWLAATVSGPLRDLGPDAEPRLVVAAPETWLLRVGEDGSLLGRVAMEDSLYDDLWTGEPLQSVALHPTPRADDEPGASSSTWGYAGFRGQPAVFAPGRRSASLVRIESTPTRGGQFRLSLVEVAKVDLPPSTTPWDIVAVGVTDAVPWLIASTENGGRTTLAHLSRCEGCSPELAVFPVGPEAASGDVPFFVTHIGVEPLSASSIQGNKRLQYTLSSSRSGTRLLAYAPEDLLDGVQATDITSTNIGGCPEGDIAPLGVTRLADGTLAAVGLLLDESGLVVGHAQAALLDAQGRLHGDGRVYLCNRGINHWGDRMSRVARSGAHTFGDVTVLQDLNGDGLTDLITSPRFGDLGPQDGWPLLLAGDGRGGFLPAEPLPATAARRIVPTRIAPSLYNPPLSSGERIMTVGPSIPPTDDVGAEVRIHVRTSPLPSRPRR